jgi:V/A-type H+-transporting ATPase subunit E
MNKNIENLEAIVSRLKDKGIQAGEEEKAKILEEAKTQAEEILNEAKLQKEEILKGAEQEAVQMQNNANAALAQAARDLTEATKIGILDHMKTVFAKECKSIFKQDEYLKELLSATVASIEGKKEIKVSPEKLEAMEAYILQQSMKEEVEIKPLEGNDAKIVVRSADNKGVQFVLSSEDVEEAMFSLLNQELTNRIIKTNQENR